MRAAMRAHHEVERRNPMGVRIAVPPEGLGRQLEIIHPWLDETCGAQGWAIAPAGTTGIVNDSPALNVEDADLAHVFVAHFCCGYRVETIGGAFAVRNDARSARRNGPAHKTP
jgi:hypothetical protein